MKLLGEQMLSALLDGFYQRFKITGDPSRR